MQQKKKSCITHFERSFFDTFQRWTKCCFSFSFNMSSFRDLEYSQTMVFLLPTQITISWIEFYKLRSHSDDEIEKNGQEHCVQRWKVPGEDLSKCLIHDFFLLHSVPIQLKKIGTGTWYLHHTVIEFASIRDVHSILKNDFLVNWGELVFQNILLPCNIV